MSGHSKWHSIKHKKAAVDAKRGKMFTKVIKEISIAARLGGSDPGGNPRLRTAVQAARDINMPKDTIDRAVKKGAGELEGVNYQDFTVEGYGQAGVAIIVEGTTDNGNRTMPELRVIFTKGGGQVGAQGCVGWMFNKRGVIAVPAEGKSEDAVMEAALEAGADDFQGGEEEFRIETDWTQVQEVRAKLEAAKIKVSSSGIESIPANRTKVSDFEEARKLLQLLDNLEDHDDVTAVWANYEIDDAIAEKLEA